MTGEVLIGQTAIPYTVRGSSRARRQRLIVRPGGVELVIPPGTGPDDIDRFLNSRRRWLYEAVRTVGALQPPETRAWAGGVMRSAASSSTPGRAMPVTWLAGASKRVNTWCTVGASRKVLCQPAR